MCFAKTKQKNNVQIKTQNWNTIHLHKNSHDFALQFIKNCEVITNKNIKK